MILAYLKIKPAAGARISDVAKLALRIADILDIGIEFTFNGTTCLVTTDMTVESVCKSYHTARIK